MVSFRVADVTVALDIGRFLMLLACLAVAFVVGGSVTRALARRRTLPNAPFSVPPFAALSFITSQPPRAVSDAVTRYAAQSGCSIITRQRDDFLMLSEPARATSLGRYYPITLMECPGVGTRVEVGMLSKVTQAPLVASKRLRRRVAGILAALGPER
jgi:hypothetical protein